MSKTVNRKRTGGSGKTAATKRQKTTTGDSVVTKIEDIANKMRIDSIKMCDAPGSGHPSSCASMAELLATLFFHPSGMKLNSDVPRSFANDKFILSKGHAAPILYSAWAEAGHIKKEDLMNLRKLTSDLEGHPTPRLDFIDVASGSLGQGLNAGCGMAYSIKYFEKAKNNVFVLCGDGEFNEGSNWEALNFAHFYKLDNLTLIVDINRLGQSDPTSIQHDIATYEARLKAFGFHTICIDGHSVTEIAAAFNNNKKDMPKAILAKTIKGKGFGDLEDLQPYHGKPLGKESERIIQLITSRIKDPNATLKTNTIKPTTGPKAPKLKVPEIPYKVGDSVSTRLAFGNCIQELGKQSNLIVGVDADVKNSTFLCKLKEVKPDQFIDCFIAEQNMIGVSIGAGVRGRIPFCSTFSTFFTRAGDHIRMGAISQCNVKFVGTHCGVSIGADGPSQMGLEDTALFRAIPNCVVLYPSDGPSTFHAVTLAANFKGMVFIRANRPDTKVFYNSKEKFEIGKSKVAISSKSDVVTVVGGGVTFEEAVKAAEILKKEKINIRVVDMFSVKPVDKETMLKCAKDTNNTIVVVEDHYPEGGMFDAVCSAVASEGVKVHQLAVNELPRSGTPEELMAKYKIDANAIVEKVRELTKKK